MSEKLDALLQQLAELNETVREHKEDKATIDRDKLAEEVKSIMEGMALVRRGESSELVGPEGFRVPDEPIIKSGKFAGHKASELAFVANLLKRAHALNPATVKLPSEELQKALTSTGVGTGDELVPTNMAAELWQDFFLSSRIVANLPRIAMPSDPFDMPLGLGDVTWRKGTQATATTATNVATDKATLTTTELVAEVDWSYHLDEDSIVAVLPALRDRLRISGAEAMDAFVLNADATNTATGNINSDDSDPDDDSYFLSAGQDGIRHLWLVDNTNQANDAGGDALADADIVAALKDMGKYAVDPNRLMIICDPKTYLAIVGLTNVRTVDKYGSQATIITGELAKYAGIPVVPSASAPLTEADGKCSATASNNTLGQLSIVHRDMWRVGFRRELLMEVDKDIQSRKFILVASFRIAVAAHGTRSSATHTAGVYNILV